MASRSFVQVVAVCLGMFSFVVGGISLRRKLLPSATDALYDCYVKQNCDCKIHERFEDCWDKLTQASRDFMIDELNKCDNVATLEYGTLKSWTDQLCPLEDSIRKPCYESVNTKMMERVIQAGIGLLGIDEVVAFEMTRKCIEPIMAYCSTFQDCMSVG